MKGFLRRSTVVFFVLVVTFALQNVFSDNIRIFNVTPNLILLIVISFGLIRGGLEGFIIGIFAGLIQDVLFGSSVGISSILYMYIGLISGKPYKLFFRENNILPFFLGIVLSFVYESIIFLNYYFISANHNISYYVVYRILPFTVYNAIFSLIVYKTIYTINSLLEKREDKERNIFI